MDRYLRKFAASTALALLGLAALFTPGARGQAPDLLVSDVGSNSVKRFDGNTGAFKGVFATGGGLNTPFGLAFGPDGNLYVSSLATHSILRYSGTTGAFIDTYVARGVGGLFYPNQIAFGPDNNLYVSSYSANGGQGAVLSYSNPSTTSTGTFLRSFSDSNLMGPTGLTFGRTNGVVDNRLYVSSSTGTAGDPTRASIFEFNTGVAGSATSGALFSNDTNLRQTAGLSIDLNGRLVASNFFGANSSISRYFTDPSQGGPRGSNVDSGGAFVRNAPGGGNLNGPVVAIFGNDLNMYVSSYNNDAVYRYNADTGTPTPSLSTFIAPGGQLDGPTYMTFFPPALAGIVAGGGDFSNLQTVPEPASLALLGLGLAGVYGLRRRRLRRAGP